jgi:ribonuclease III
MNARADAVARLERRLGYAFKDRALLEQALTHASVAGLDRNARHNQVLEFLGDRVIGLFAAERLAELFPEAAEGELTQKLHALVRKEACAAVAARIELGDALRMAGSGNRRAGHVRMSILGDAAEALMAALYLDGGADVARTVFLDLWGQLIAAVDRTTPLDPKTKLQEWALGLGRPLPAYAIISRDGPAHRPEFSVSVAVDGCQPASGKGPSRQAAEMAAAAALLAAQGVS